MNINIYDDDGITFNKHGPDRRVTSFFQVDPCLQERPSYTWVTGQKYSEFHVRT